MCTEGAGRLSIFDEVGVVTKTYLHGSVGWGDGRSLPTVGDVVLQQLNKRKNKLNLRQKEK